MSADFCTVSGARLMIKMSGNYRVILCGSGYCTFGNYSTTINLKLNGLDCISKEFSTNSANDNLNSGPFYATKSATLFEGNYFELSFTKQANCYPAAAYVITAPAN